MLCFMYDNRLQNTFIEGKPEMPELTSENILCPYLTKYHVRINLTVFIFLTFSHLNHMYSAQIDEL